jgi:hypothetical protein
MVSLVILVVGLVLVDVLALVFGHDSRNEAAPPLRADWLSNWHQRRAAR